MNYICMFTLLICLSIQIIDFIGCGCMLPQISGTLIPAISIFLCAQWRIFMLFSPKFFIKAQTVGVDPHSLRNPGSATDAGYSLNNHY